MKATELMIGNLVNRKMADGTFKSCKILSIDKYAIVDLLDGYILKLCVDDLFTIPLTPEILEKNGFVNVFRGRYRFDDDKGSIIEISTIKSKVKWIRVSKYDENIEEQLSNCTFNEMHYVHELQNALTLLKIGKEIEL